MYKSLFIIAFIWQIASYAQTAFDYPPINYASAVVNNEIEVLKKKIKNSEIELKFNEKFGYLPSVLKALNIKHSSQSLVFSKTSFQRELISPKTPRAMYFNDNTYIGWIPGSDVLEIMSNDPKLGAIFYTMEQKPLEKPVIVRNDHDCLDCHSSARTQSVPGGMLKSRFINLEGSLMSTVVNHRTPINQRWGSWYITGTSPADHHLGNLRKADEDIDNVNVTDLAPLFDVKQYLTDSSDIVSLMVMEHQIHMTNLITRAAYRTRVILHKRDLEESATENIDEDDLEDISRQLTPLLDYMLFVDEAHINGPIKGNTDYKSSFEGIGSKTKNGKSLRQLDLHSRLFKYPLSYMIYSENFRQLPPIAKKIILKNLKDILKGKNLDQKYKYLTESLRNEIQQILKETLQDYETAN